MQSTNDVIGTNPGLTLFPTDHKARWLINRVFDYEES